MAYARGHSNPSTRLGGSAFNHNQSSSSEEEYDRLRNLARQEHSRMADCFAKSKQAYSSGNGAEAHELSQAGKKHQEAAESYNAQASAYIFRENNSESRVPSDTIDLHGQFVEEAEDILEARIKQARAENQTHLHVIVGKGNHSPGHIQKIKPRVEQVCQQLGLQYHTEQNEGRMYIDLTGGNIDYNVPHPGQQPQKYQGGGYPGQPQQYGQQQPQYGQPQQQFQMEQNQQKDDPLISCLKSCCTIM